MGQVLVGEHCFHIFGIPETCSKWLQVTSAAAANELPHDVLVLEITCVCTGVAFEAKAHT